MAATFREQMETDLAAFFNAEEFGQAAVYFRGVQRIETTVLLEPLEDAPDNWQGGQAIAGRAMVQRSAVTDPQPHDRFEITSTGEDWQVQRVLGSTEKTWTLEVIMDLRPRPAK
jgi:hypothetical protein